MASTNNWKLARCVEEESIPNAHDFILVNLCKFDTFPKRYSLTASLVIRLQARGYATNKYAMILAYIHPIACD